nr:hypothetical protein BaRGS_004549 [Batillaria attramentaria]
MADNGMTVYVLNINFLKVCIEEDADEEDREALVDDFLDLSEDFPLFVITDETCQEPERLDPVIPDLATKDSRFHFWSSSAYAHGTPDIARRYRLATHHTVSAPIKLVMDMIDIDDDDVDITGPHHVPLRRIVWPDEGRGKGNVMAHLEKLPVKMISHRNHEERDVWQCEPCGQLLAEYLLDDLELGVYG